MSKKSRFRGCFDKQYGKRAQALLKYASRHLYRIHWSLARTLCSEKFLLLTWHIMGLLVNTMTADEKYLVFHGDNLTISIQIQVSQKKKRFLKKKLGSHNSFCLSKITDSENVVK